MRKFVADAATKTIRVLGMPAWRVMGRTLAVFFVLSGCAAEPGACVLQTQRPMIAVDLYFGRGGVSEAAWADFAAGEITQAFPDGFSVFAVRGQWLNPATHAIDRENSRMVRVVVPGGSNVSARVEAVSLAYRRRFHQTSVGVVSSAVCAAF